MQQGRKATRHISFLHSILYFTSIMAGIIELFLLFNHRRRLHLTPFKEFKSLPSLIWLACNSTYHVVDTYVAD